jgi:hypothetical protein
MGTYILQRAGCSVHNSCQYVLPYIVFILFFVFMQCVSYLTLQKYFTILVRSVSFFVTGICLLTHILSFFVI